MYSKISLTIGGSDSGGGAGIQADLKTFMSHNIHGCSVITCVTAQNSVNVIGVEAIGTQMLNNQFDAVFTDFRISALKTGMLLNEEIIFHTALKLKNQSIPKVIDPVMCTRTGARLLEESAINAYKEFLIPQAEILTPNIFEANLLANTVIKDMNDVEKASERILDYGCKSVLVKGGGIQELKGKDFFKDKKGNSFWLKNKFIDTKNTHGSGCTLSAAICSHLALGIDLLESVKKSKTFIEKSLVNSYKIGAGPGPLGHYQSSCTQETD